LSNDEATAVRIYVDEVSTLSRLTEIICCCSSYNNKPTIPPVMTISILIIFLTKYPNIIPMKKLPPTDVTAEIILSVFIF